jgi:hypothetical protein
MQNGEHFDPFTEVARSTAISNSVSEAARNKRV